MTLARLLRIARQRLRSLVAGRTLDADLDAELSFHFEQLVREKLDEGLPLERARVAARRELGNVALFHEQGRDERRIGWLSDARRDMAYGWRMLRKHLGFSAVAIASLAIGIGANVAVWGAVKAVELDPLPFPDGDRLVVIRMTAPEGAQGQGATSAEYFAWRERSRTIEAMGASWSSQRLVGPGTDAMPADRLASQAFTPGLFSLLGVQPAQGRLFTDTTDPYSPDALVVVLSHRLWQERYGGAADIVGRSIRIDGAMRTVVGVLADDFRYQQDNVAFWIPLIFGPNAARNPDAARLLQVTARLRPGQTAAGAESELNGIEADLAAAFPDRFEGWTVRVTPLREHLYGRSRQALYTLVAASALLLVIACVNLSGLLLARATARQQELWVRVSLGATRWRVVRQLMTEGVLLAIGGGALGAVVAAACLPGLTFLMPPFPGLPRLTGLQFDAELLALAFLLSLFAALAFSTLPAIAAARLVRVRWSPGHPAGDDRRTVRLRNATVVAQIAIATVLLVGGGLLSKSFIRLASRDLGVDVSRTLSFKYVMEPRHYTRALGQDEGVPSFEIADHAPDTLARIYRRLQSVPGVESVAGSSFPPINSFTVPRFPVTPLDGDAGRGAASSTNETTTVYFLVSPGYFAAMRTPIVRGREFHASDDREARPVAVVNETAARLLWPGADAVGRRLAVDIGPDVPPVEIVGVVQDIPTRRREQAVDPIVYGTFLQTPAVFRGRGVTMFGRMTFVLRHTGDATAVLAAARRAVAEIDPERPLVDVGVVERHLYAQMPELRNYVAAVGAFGVTAMLLAAIGVYGVAAFTVAVRLRELCIRRALGAGPWEVVRLVTRRAMVLVVLGLALGLVAARGLVRLVESDLWRVAPTDPATFATAGALLATAAAVACAGPLRRALAADPATVLRRE